MSRLSDQTSPHPDDGADHAALEGRELPAAPATRAQRSLRVRLSAFTDRVELTQSTPHVLLPARRLRDHLERDPALSLRVRLEGRSVRVQLSRSSGSTVRLEEDKLERIVFERVILKKLETTPSKSVNVARIEVRLVALNPALLRAWLEYIRDGRSLARLRWLNSETIINPPWIALDLPGPRLTERRFGHDRQTLYEASATLAERFWRGHCVSQSGLADLKRLEPSEALRAEIAQWFSDTDRDRRSQTELPDGVICLDQGYQHCLEGGLYLLRSPIGTVSASPRPGIPPYVIQMLEAKPDAAGEVGLIILWRRAGGEG